MKRDSILRQLEIDQTIDAFKEEIAYATGLPQDQLFDLEKHEARCIRMPALVSSIIVGSQPSSKKKDSAKSPLSIELYDQYKAVLSQTVEQPFRDLVMRNVMNNDPRIIASAMLDNLDGDIKKLPEKLRPFLPNMLSP